MILASGHSQTSESAKPPAAGPWRETRASDSLLGRSSERSPGSTPLETK